MKLLKTNLEIIWEKWSDPGDYPNALASGPLPSHFYVSEIIGEIAIRYPKPIPFSGKVSQDDLEDFDFQLSELLEENTPPEIIIQEWFVEQKIGIITFTVLDFQECS